MKALTVQQPWAWAIAAGHKTIENRSRNVPYRGPLAIHAGRRWSDRGGASRLIIDALGGGDGAECALEDAEAGGWPRGVIIAVADLVDCHPDAECCRPWGESSYANHGTRKHVTVVHHLVLENVRALAEPVLARGMLGLWRVPEDLVREIDAQLGAP